MSRNTRNGKFGNSDVYYQTYANLPDAQKPVKPAISLVDMPLFSYLFWTYNDNDDVGRSPAAAQTTKGCENFSFALETTV